MGHWWESEEFLDQVAARVGVNADRAALKLTARAAAERIQLLAGRSFGTSEQKTETVDSGGLPFVDVEDLQIGTHSTDIPVWPVPDLANPALARVLQVRPPEAVAPAAAPQGQALRTAGRFVAEVHRQRRLSPEFVLHGLRPLFSPDVDPQQRLDYFGRLADPASRIHVAIAAAYADGWWMQISRRLMLVTKNTPDDQCLVEPLIENLPLVAVEPVLIVARTTTHPVESAFVARIWRGGTDGAPTPWRIIARAVHRYGIPILTVDDASTPDETGCQLMLLAYWHGYLTQDEPSLADAVALAYPRAVHRIRVATGVPDERSAAALLLEGLLHPGFDPMRGAHSVRKYVSRKATIAVLEHRKLSRAGAHPWERLGVSERTYYKLLPRFAHREAGRWQIDDDVRKRIGAYLRNRDKHAAAVDLLRDRGFSEAGARKWLQRHPVDDARGARPRRPAAERLRPAQQNPTPSSRKTTSVAAFGRRAYPARTARQGR